MRPPRPAPQPPAAQGRSGVQFARDPRGIEVVSAHVPIEDLGLGFALKTDVATLYAPLRARLGRLAANERCMRQVTDHLPVRIAYLDRDARSRCVNEAHCQRLGLPREQIVRTAQRHAPPGRELHPAAAVRPSDGVARHIIAAAGRPFQVGALRLATGASVGIAISEEPDEDPAALGDNAPP